MNIKQFKQSIKILEELKIINTRIEEIERVAKIAAEGSLESVIELKIKSKDQAQEKKDIFDEDGSLKVSSEYDSPKWSFLPSPSHFAGALSRLNELYPTYEKDKETKFDVIIKPATTDITILKVLGILLQEAMDEKEKLEGKLKRAGINIES